SVLVSGLDFWWGKGPEILEPRLAAKLADLLETPEIRLYAPPPEQDDPTLPPTGIDAFQFPEWFITQDVEPMAPDVRVRSRRLVHRNRLTAGKLIDLNKKKRTVVPVRFVRPCRGGH